MSVTWCLHLSLPALPSTRRRGLACMRSPWMVASVLTGTAGTSPLIFLKRTQSSLFFIVRLCDCIVSRFNLFFQPQHRHIFWSCSTFTTFNFTVWVHWGSLPLLCVTAESWFCVCGWDEVEGVRRALKPTFFCYLLRHRWSCCWRSVFCCCC